MSLIARWLLAATIALLAPAQASTPLKKVVTDSVTLLNTEQEFAERVSVGDLAAFLKLAESMAHQVLAANEVPARVIVQFDCVPGRTSITISSRGKADAAVLQSLHAMLSKANPLPARGSVSFQVSYRIR